MRKASIFIPCVVSISLLASCSPRDFLTRRLAADLIASSSTFRAPQQFELRTGILSNQDHLSHDYLVLQHHGWISAAQARCPPDITPPPCWDVTLTPAGVDTIRDLLPSEIAGSQTLRIPAARRELLAVTGVSKQGRVADVDFTWQWTPLNEVGAVLFSRDTHYRSTAGFRCYDDGWRLVQSASPSGQPLDEALKNAEPVQ
jgi:hypothetical protein